MPGGETLAAGAAREGGAAAIRAGVALVDRSFRDRLEVAGADRARFLNGYVTADVATLAPGGAAIAFLTNAKGGILADAVVVALADRFWLELPEGRGAAIAAHLAKYVVADRVELRALPDLALVALEGARAEETLRAAGFACPEGPWTSCESASAGLVARIVRHGFPRRGRFTFWLPAEDAPRLVANLGAGGARPLAATERDLLEIEDGEPVWGVDISEENLPQETGLDAAVSFTKGCYLGQEVVARLHYRGQAARRLMGLLVAAGAPPVRGAEVRLEGRAAGRVTRAARSPERGVLALALLQRRAADPGTRVELEGGAAAQVSELPFAV